MEVNGVQIVVTKSFTPQESNGKTVVEFSFDATGLAGKTIVVFEELFDENYGLLIAHEDINDLSQTVTLVNEKRPDTGVNTSGVETLGLFMVSVGVAVLLTRKKKEQIIVE